MGFVHFVANSKISGLFAMQQVLLAGVMLVMWAIWRDTISCLYGFSLSAW
jgi:hypothetical protein